MVVVAILGVRKIDLNARVLAALLTLEILALLVFDLGSLLHPDHGRHLSDGFALHDLFGSTGTGVVFAFIIASFAGFESGAIYSEESLDPEHTVGRATFAAIAFTGILYAASSWFLLIAAGPNKLTHPGPDGNNRLLFQLLTTQWDAAVGTTANALFLTSIFAAMLSFHNGVARYLFALGRERVLPAQVGRTSARHNAPTTASLIQTTIAILTVAAFTLAGIDPIATLFTWGSTLAAGGIVLLMAATSAATIAFFRKKPTRESLWQRLLAPGIATVLLTVMAGYIIDNYGQLVGPDQPPQLSWVLPLLLLFAILTGLVWAAIIKRRRPEIYQRIGHGHSSNET